MSFTLDSPEYRWDKIGFRINPGDKIVYAGKLYSVVGYAGGRDIHISLCDIDGIVSDAKVNTVSEKSVVCLDDYMNDKFVYKTIKYRESFAVVFRDREKPTELYTNLYRVS